VASGKPGSEGGREKLDPALLATTILARVTIESDAPPEPQDPEAKSTGPASLAAISKDEFRAIWRSATQVALRFTKSKLRADELMSDVYEKLVTKRLWSGKEPLEEHLIGIMKSLLYIQRRSKKGEREVEAQKGFQREVRPEVVASVEEAAIETGDAAEREADATRELEELQRRAAKHPVMSGVLRCKAAGTHKAADIAVALNVPVQQVYRAIELLKDHMQRMRAGENE
jgi:DNA-directed RNA polymerase specialized sigma24 family protein